jgi:hypothetical protein
MKKFATLISILCICDVFAGTISSYQLGGTTYFSGTDANGNRISGDSMTLGNTTYTTLRDNNGNRWSGDSMNLGNTTQTTLRNNGGNEFGNTRSYGTTFNTVNDSYNTFDWQQQNRKYNDEDEESYSRGRNALNKTQDSKAVKRRLTWSEQRLQAKVQLNRSKKMEREKRLKRQQERDEQNRIAAEEEEQRRIDRRKRAEERNSKYEQERKNRQEKKDALAALEHCKVAHGIIQNINGCEVCLTSGGDFLLQEKQDDWHCGDWVAVYDIPNLGLVLFNEKKEVCAIGERK